MMRAAKEYSDTAKRKISAGIDVPLAAISEINENGVYRNQNDSEHVSVSGHKYYIWHELTDTFELDIHDPSVSEVDH